MANKSNPRVHPAFTLLVCAFALTSRMEARAQTAAPVPVRIAPESVQVAADATVDVAVEVNAVEGLYAANVALAFDPDVVEVVDADPNLDGIQVALGMFLDPGFVLRNLADNAEGSVRFAMTQLNPSEAKSGSGALIVVKLRGKHAGSNSPLTLVDAQLSERGGVSIPATLHSGNVHVIDESDAAGQDTSIPSQAAGTVMPTSTSRPTARATTVPSPAPAIASTATDSVRFASPTVLPSASSTIAALTPTAKGTASPKVLTSSQAPTHAGNALTAASTASLPTPIQPMETPTVSIEVVTETPEALARAAMIIAPGDQDSSMQIVPAASDRGEKPQAAPAPAAPQTLLRGGLVTLFVAALSSIALGIAWWSRRPKGQHPGGV